MMRAPERLDPSAVVEIDEEIHRAEKPIRGHGIERPDLPIGRIAAEEIAQERRAAQDPDEVARIVRIGGEDRGCIVRPFERVGPAVAADHGAGFQRPVARHPPGTRVEHAVPVMVEERWCIVESRQLRAHRRTDRCPDHLAAEHGLSMPMDERVVVVRLTEAVEGRMVDDQQARLGLDAQSAVRQMSEQRRVVREDETCGDRRIGIEQIGECLRQDRRGFADGWDADTSEPAL